jgi:hypothetical protein
MPVAIKGTGGGSVTLTASTAAADTTLTLPNTSGTILQSGTAVTVTQGGTGAATLTANGALIGNGTSAVTAVSPTTTGNVLFTTDGSTWSATQKIVAGTAQASTSGTSIDFTGIPSWVKKVTVMFNNVSLNGTASYLVQLGNGSVVTSGYTTTYTGIFNATVGGTANVSNGWQVPSATAASLTSGQLFFTKIDANIWIGSSSFCETNTARTVIGSGALSLASALDRVRITTTNGTDTFDAGSINILYE